MRGRSYPSLRVRFTIGHHSDTATAIVDTGFDGHLVIPESLIGTLPDPDRTRRMRTASGEVVMTAMCIGLVEITDVPGDWPGEIFALGDEYLIGIRMLNHFRLILDHGQRINGEP